MRPPGAPRTPTESSPTATSPPRRSRLGADAFFANFVGPDERTPAQAEQRALTEELVGEVLAADTILLAMCLAGHAKLAAAELALAAGEDEILAGLTHAQRESLYQLLWQASDGLTRAASPSAGGGSPDPCSPC
jgi:hypothetical protein